MTASVSVTAERRLAQPALAKPTLAPRPVVASRSALGDWLLGRLRVAATHRGPTMLAVPAPRVAPEALLELAPAELETEAVTTLWDPVDGPAMSGVGAVRRVELRGSSRLADFRIESERLFEELAVERHPEVDVFEARLYGGLAFDVGAEIAPPWTELGDGSFVLPRLMYRCDGDTGALALVVEPAALRDGAARRRQADLVLDVLDRLRDMPATTRPLEPLGEAHLAAPDVEEWQARVGAIRRAIAEGSIDKIVAARRVEVNLSRPLRPTEVLRRLNRGLRASTRFAFGRRDTAFVGVTPERLISKRGRNVWTEALAGSIASGDGGDTLVHADELLHSGKDRHEQQLVVDSIVRRLEPWCDRLQVEERRVRELRDVLHLHTPIRGRLRADRHVLDLVGALHPTPAVGGVPTDAALRWIREREPHHRGWYAGPIGWIDGRGDGELWVGLRSAVLDGARAWLWVGAGIVSDSDPQAELRETELKQEALLGALGGAG
ncbi:MAG: isochorismate synthase [Acidobacteriota bacterium]